MAIIPYRKYRRRSRRTIRRRRPRRFRTKTRRTSHRTRSRARSFRRRGRSNGSKHSYKRKIKAALSIVPNKYYTTDNVGTFAVVADPTSSTQTLQTNYAVLSCYDCLDMFNCITASNKLDDYLNPVIYGSTSNTSSSRLMPNNPVMDAYTMEYRSTDIITSTCNFPITVRRYVIQARHDIGRQRDINANDDATPVSMVFNAIVSSQTMLSKSAIAPSLPYSTTDYQATTLYQYPVLTSQFKILSSKTFNMLPGSKRMFNVKQRRMCHKINGYKFTNGYINQITTAFNSSVNASGLIPPTNPSLQGSIQYLFPAKYGRCVVYQMYTNLVYQSDVLGGISQFTSSVACEQRKRITWKSIPQSRVYHYHNPGTGLTQAGLLSNTKIINPLDGDVDTPRSLVTNPV